MWALRNPWKRASKDDPEPEPSSPGPVHPPHPPHPLPLGASLGALKPHENPQLLDPLPEPQNPSQPSLLPFQPTSEPEQPPMSVSPPRPEAEPVPVAEPVEAEPLTAAHAEGGFPCKVVGPDGKPCGAGPFKTTAGLGNHEARIHSRRGLVSAARSTLEEEWDSVGSLPAGPTEVPFSEREQETTEEDYPPTPIDTTPQSELARRVDAQLRDLGYNTSQWKYRRNLIYKNLCRTPALGQTPFQLRQFLHNMGIRLEHIELVIMDVWGDGAAGPFGAMNPQAAMLQPGAPQPMNPMYAQPYGQPQGYGGYPYGYQQPQPQAPQSNGGNGGPKSEFQQFKDHITFAKEMGLIQPAGQQPHGPAWQDPSNYTKSLVDTFAAGKQDALAQQNSMAAMWKQQTDFLTTMLKNEQDKNNRGDNGGGGSLIEALNFANEVGLLRKPEDMNDFLEKQKKLQELGLIGTTQNVEVAKFQADHTMNMRRLELDQRRFELEQAAKRQEQVDQAKKFDALTNLAGSAFEKIGNPIARAVSQGLQDRMGNAQGAPAPAGPQPALNNEERRQKLMALRQRVDAELSQAQPQPQTQPPAGAP